MKGGGLTRWNAIAICEASKTSWRMGNLRTKGRFGEPFKGPIIPFGAMVVCHPTSPKDQAMIINFGKKVLPGIFLGYELVAGKFWKGDILMADLEDLEKLEASDIYPLRIIAKEVLTSQK